MSEQDAGPVTSVQPSSDLLAKAAEILGLPEISTGTDPQIVDADPQIIDSSKTSAVRLNRLTSVGRKPIVMTAAAVVTAGLLLLAGGALFGGSGGASSPSSAVMLAERAASAWMNDDTFTGPRLASIPADMSRHGATVQGTVEPVGFSTSSGITDGLFIINPQTGEPFGLSVVIYKGQLAYPPTVVSLPFATSIPRGREPQIPESGRTIKPTLNNQAQVWAKTTFGSGQGSLDLTLGGPIKVLAQWVPSPALTVARVQVPLTALIPTPDPRLAADERNAQAAQAAFNTAKAAFDASNAAVAADSAASAAAAQTAAQPGAAPTAQQTATAAAATLTTAQQAQTASQQQVTATQQALQKTNAALSAVRAVHTSTFNSVYDVTFNKTGQPTGWAPADYKIGNAS